MRTLAVGVIAAEVFFFFASHILGWFLGRRVAKGSQPELTTVWCRLWRAACFSLASWPLAVFAFMAYGVQQVANRTSLATNIQTSVYWASLLAIIAAFAVGQVYAAAGSHRAILNRTVCWRAPKSPALTSARYNAKDRILHDDRDECRNGIVRILKVAAGQSSEGIPTASLDPKTAVEPTVTAGTSPTPDTPTAVPIHPSPARSTRPSTGGSASETRPDDVETN